MSADWLADEFDFEVVMMIRHPAAFAASLRRVGWSFDFRNLLLQDELMERRLSPYATEVRKFSEQTHDIVDQAGLLWKCIYAVVAQYRNVHTDWHFVRHEDLSRDPHGEFGRLAVALGLPFGGAMEAVVQRLSSRENPTMPARGVVHELSRNSRENIDVWKTLLSAEELQVQLHGLAGPTRKLPDRRFHELFGERVRIHPSAIAAVQGDRRLTYGELNSRANRLARALRARGLGPEGVVAVVTERNLDWMTAVLAVFKAGGAYLPIEPHFPADRIATTLSRADCRIVLTEPASTATLGQAVTSLTGV